MLLGIHAIGVGVTAMTKMVVADNESIYRTRRSTLRSPITSRGVASAWWALCITLKQEYVLHLARG
jgi:hypothetical protein